MYLITIPQIAQRNKSKTYNLNKKIIKVSVVEEYPNRMLEVKDSSEKHYRIPSYYRNAHNLEFIQNTWEGRTMYLLFDKLDDAEKMHVELLGKIISFYTDEIDKLSSKVKDIKHMISEHK